MANTVRHKRYIFVDPDALKGVGGHNKFWNITEYDDGSIYVEWGRVGANAQTKMHPPYSQSFDKLCDSKLKKGYTEAKVIASESGKVTSLESGSLKKVAREQIKTHSPVVDNLITLLINKNKHQILQATTMSYNEETGLFTTPLGVVTRDAISDARDILVKISKNINRLEDKSVRNDISDYLRLIPTKCPSNRNVVDFIFRDNEVIQKQGQILDALEASIDSMESQPVNNVESSTESVFKVEMELIEDNKIMKHIKDMYHKTHNSSHECRNLDVIRAYTLNIQSMSDAFEKCGAKLDNIWELYHGTRVSNILSILSKGMIIPPSNASYTCGRMFGDGLYFSDQSTKSLNYSYGYWDGGARDSNCFMLMCKVAMGKYYTPKDRYDSPFPKKGYDSIFAKAHKSGVYNNEMIVYQTGQVKPEFLVEFSS